MGARAQDKPNALSTYRLNSGDVISIGPARMISIGKDAAYRRRDGIIPILGEVGARSGRLAKSSTCSSIA
jgi:hypothetical protein